MPVLLETNVDADGDILKVIGPASIFVEGSDFGGGTVTVYAYRDSDTEQVALGSYTEGTVVVDTIIGEHYLSASLVGASSPSTIIVATNK